MTSHSTPPTRPQVPRPSSAPAIAVLTALASAALVVAAYFLAKAIFFGESATVCDSDDATVGECFLDSAAARRHDDLLWSMGVASGLAGAVLSAWAVGVLLISQRRR